MAGQLRQVDFHTGAEENIQCILRFSAGPTIGDVYQMPALANDTFGEEKARGKLAVVARSAHGNRHATTAHADLQWLLDGNNVGTFLGLTYRSQPQYGYGGRPPP
jgi:hypothetical protein